MSKCNHAGAGVGSICLFCGMLIAVQPYEAQKTRQLEHPALIMTDGPVRAFTPDHGAETQYDTDALTFATPSASGTISAPTLPTVVGDLRVTFRDRYRP